MSFRSAARWAGASFSVLAAAAGAQELEPRAYINLPVGLNFAIVGYSYTEGGIATDTALPIENAELALHGAVVAYARTLDFWGKSGKIDLVVPYGRLSGSAEVAGEPVERRTSGFFDPKIRVSVNLYGAPALAPREFASYEQDWIVGASFQVGAPAGEYDADRVVNLGSNRWSFKPEIGVSKSVGRSTIDVAAAASLYTDNDEFRGGGRREQDPVYSLQGHWIVDLRRRSWLALDATYYFGGTTTVDGASSDDRLSSSRFGLTFSQPFGRRDSVKVSVSTGLSARTGSDFDAVGLFWQRRWGAGP